MSFNESSIAVYGDSMASVRNDSRPGSVKNNIRQKSAAIKYEFSELILMFQLSS